MVACAAASTVPLFSTPRSSPHVRSDGVSLTTWTWAYQGGAVARALTNIDPPLRRCWHPVARSGDVTEQPHGVMLLGEPWVMYRSGGSVLPFAGDLVAAVESGCFR